MSGTIERDGQPNPELDIKTDKLFPIIYKPANDSGESLPLRLVLVGQNSDRRLATLVQEKIGETKLNLENAKRVVLRDELKKNKYGRSGAENRPQREITDIARTQIRTFSDDLSILEGRTIGPITVTLGTQGKPLSLTVGRFSNEDLREIWRPIKVATDQVNTYKGLKLILEGFNLQMENKLGQEDPEQQDFFRRYDDFLENHPELTPAFGNALRAIRSI